AIVSIIPFLIEDKFPTYTRRIRGTLIVCSILIMLLSMFQRSREIQNEKSRTALEDSFRKEKFAKDSIRFTLDTLKHQRTINTLTAKNLIDSLRYAATFAEFRAQKDRQILTLEKVNEGLVVQNESVNQYTGGDAFCYVDFRYNRQAD